MSDDDLPIDELRALSPGTVVTLRSQGPDGRESAAELTVGDTGGLHLVAVRRGGPPTEHDAELAAIAHDFNNLLGVIGNYTQFAIDATPAGSETLADLAEVQRAADRGAELTRRLMRAVDA